MVGSGETKPTESHRPCESKTSASSSTILCWGILSDRIIGDGVRRVRCGVRQGVLDVHVDQTIRVGHPVSVYVTDSVV